MNCRCSGVHGVNRTIVGSFFALFSASIFGGHFSGFFMDLAPFFGPFLMFFSCFSHAIFEHDFALIFLSFLIAFCVGEPSAMCILHSKYNGLSTFSVFRKLVFQRFLCRILHNYRDDFWLIFMEFLLFFRHRFLHRFFMKSEPFWLPKTLPGSPCFAPFW